MFIANDSNYTFGQYLDRETVDIKAPVYTKCFTDTEELKGYRFVHDPEETNPEICVSFSIYDAVSEAATATPFLSKAAVSDLSSVMFRLDTEFVESVLRDVPFYHVIVPVENIADGTLKYLVIKMTKEVEIFPENYPYYELADTFADAQPTSADAPTGGGGGGETGGGELITANFTVNNQTDSAVDFGRIRGVVPNIIDVPDFYSGLVAMLDVQIGEVGAGSTVTETVSILTYGGKVLMSDYAITSSDSTLQPTLSGGIEAFTEMSNAYVITDDFSMTYILER